MRPCWWRVASGVVRVAAGLFGLALRDRNAGARRQRKRQVKAGSRRDGFVGQAPGRDPDSHAPAQPGPRKQSRSPPAWAGDWRWGIARRDRIVRRGNVARGQGRDSQPGVGEAWEEPAPELQPRPRRPRWPHPAPQGVPAIRQHERLHEQGAALPVPRREPPSASAMTSLNCATAPTESPLIPCATARLHRHRREGGPVTDGVGEVASTSSAAARIAIGSPTMTDPVRLPARVSGRASTRRSIERARPIASATYGRATSGS